MLIGTDEHRHARGQRSEIRDRRMPIQTSDLRPRGAKRLRIGVPIFIRIGGQSPGWLKYAS